MSRKNKKYSPEFKISVILDMRENHLGYKETIRKYWEGSRGKENHYFKQVHLWERIFLEEGPEGLYGEKFESPRGFFEKLEEYIHYYNNERISMKLKGMSPVQYRTHSQSI